MPESEQQGPIALSPEQQFKIAAFNMQIQSLDVQESKDLLVEIYRQMMLQENNYKKLLAHQWGIDPKGMFRRSDG